MGEKKEKKDKEKKEKEKEKATVRSAPDGSDNKGSFIFDKFDEGSFNHFDSPRCEEPHRPSPPLFQCLQAS